MSLMSFIKKQFIDIIQWTESGDDALAWRFPTTDLEIQYGASLTVRESQVAVFVNEGQIADVFGPGQHTLTTQTLPVLTYLKNWDKLFESPFKSEVYFFSTRQRIGRKWGTPQAITVRDKDFGAVQLRAFGQYAYRIADARQFYQAVSGTRESYSMAEIEDQLRGSIVSAMASAIGGSGTPFLDLAANQADLARLVGHAVTEKFTPFGLALENFELMSLSLPEALQDALDSRIRMGMLGDMTQYTRMQAADSLPLAAANEGGGMAATAAQMAVGVGLGQVLQQSLAEVPASAAPAGDTPAAKLAQLKTLLDQGLIGPADYESAKQALLAKLVG